MPDTPSSLGLYSPRSRTNPEVMGVPGRPITGTQPARMRSAYSVTVMASGGGVGSIPLMGAELTPHCRLPKVEPDAKGGCIAGGAGIVLPAIDSCVAALSAAAVPMAAIADGV